VDFDSLHRAAVALPVDQQTRLIFELSNRLGVYLHREVSGDVRRRIQERAADLEDRGGPMIAAHLDELGAPRPAAGSNGQTASGTGTRFGGIGSP
jgi:hypothetical protein